MWKQHKNVECVKYNDKVRKGIIVVRMKAEN